MSYLQTELPTSVNSADCLGQRAASNKAALAMGLLSAGLASAATPTLSAEEASRFLSQAGFGGTSAQIADLQNTGIAAWINSQFATASDQSHWDWLIARGYDQPAFMSGSAGIDATLWRKLMASPDMLRQRVTLALSEIFVVSLQTLRAAWNPFQVGAFVDMLAANAFGNFRNLLEGVTLSPAMGLYLGTRGNQKGDPVSGRQPDENYGREVMQLFTIGLYQMEMDGSIKRDSSGKPLEVYALDTVTQIARVFTGWNFDAFISTQPYYARRPMVLNPLSHSPLQKSFLGVTIPAGTDGREALRITLDTLFNHPNVAPFISRQLIQRLVTSNPSPAYIGRVARVFVSGDGGVRGDMKSIIRAILLDPEARPTAGNQTDSTGKLREPMVRLLQWARTFKAVSASGKWEIGDTSNPTSLGQSPLRAPSVFNFFRPGYAPSGGILGNADLVAPELQITNEATVVGYVNFMLRAVDGKLADLIPDYSAELAIAADAAALLKRLNMLLAAGQISQIDLSAMQTAVATISAATDAGKLNRVKAAIMLVMSSPEYIVQK